MKRLPNPGAGTVVVAIFITCLLLFLFQKTTWLVMPALVSLMLFYCLRPVIRFLVHRGMKHEWAVTWVWLLLQLVSAVAAWEIFRFIITQVGSWENNYDRYVAAAQNLMAKTTAPLEALIPALKRADMGAQLNQQITQLGANLTGKELLPVTLLTLKWLPCVLLVPYITYFLLKDAVRLKKFIIRSVPNAFFEKSLLLFSRLDVSLQSYFQGLLWLTLLDTACLSGGLKVLGIPKALWLGLGSAVLAWIPYIGSIIACAMVVLVAAVDFPDSVQVAYACLILFLIVRILDDFIFLPLTIGRKLHVHPLLSLLILFLGGTVAGGTGLLLALPVFGVVSVISDVASKIVTDQKLIARFWMTRRLADENCKKLSGPRMTPS